MKNVEAIGFSDITLEFLRIVANNLVILLKNVKQIKIGNAVLIEHSYLYLSPTFHVWCWQ